MHYVGYYDLAAAVSNAGGLGIITALTQATPEDLRREIRKCKALTNKPFGCNLTLLPVTVNPDYEGYCKVIIEEGVPVVETAGRNPGKYIKLFHDAGIIVIHKCVAIRHALTAIKQGADMISMDGFECAGHPGSFFTCPGRYQHLLLLTILTTLPCEGEEDIGNWVLLAKAGRVLTVPFVASGGCATGSQLAAAIALGAEGVNMGTRFMATKEAPIHDNIKQALVDNDERSTTHIFRTLHNTERV